MGVGFGLLGALGQRQENVWRAQASQSALFAEELGGLGERSIAFARPQPTKKKSFMDELQDDIDNWLKDVEL